MNRWLISAPDETINAARGGKKTTARSCGDQFKDRESARTSAFAPRSRRIWWRPAWL